MDLCRGHPQTRQMSALPETPFCPLDFCEITLSLVLQQMLNLLR